MAHPAWATDILEVQGNTLTKKNYTGTDVDVHLSHNNNVAHVILDVKKQDGVGGNIYFHLGPQDKNGDNYQVYRSVTMMRADGKISLNDRLALYTYTWSNDSTKQAAVGDFKSNQFEAHSIATGDYASAYITTEGEPVEETAAIKVGTLYSKGSNAAISGVPWRGKDYYYSGNNPPAGFDSLPPKENYNYSIRMEAKNGDVELGQVMSYIGKPDFKKAQVMGGIYVEGKNVKFIGGGLTDASVFATNGNIDLPSDISHFSIDAGNAQIKASAGNLDTTGFDPNQNLNYDIRAAEASKAAPADAIYNAKYKAYQKAMRETAYLGNVRNRNGGLVLEAVAKAGDETNTGKVLLHDVVVEDFDVKTMTDDFVFGDIIIKGQHIIQQNGDYSIARSWNPNITDSQPMEIRNSKGTFMNDGMSHLISEEEIKMQNFFVTNGEIHAQAKEKISVELYTNNADNEKNTDLIKNPSALGGVLRAGQTYARDKELQGTVAEFNTDAEISFDEIDLSKRTSVRRDTITLNNQKDENDEDDNARPIEIGKLILKEGNQGYFLAEDQINLGDPYEDNVEHVVDGKYDDSPGGRSLAIFESKKGSIIGGGTLTVSNSAHVDMRATAAGNHIYLHKLSAENKGTVNIMTDGYNDTLDMTHRGTGDVGIETLGLHTGGVVNIWAKKSLGNTEIKHIHLQSIEGDENADPNNLGMVTAYDTNIKIDTMTGSSIVNLYRSDAEGKHTLEELKEANWVPDEGTKGLNTYVGSIGAGKNVFSMTLSTIGERSDYLYIANGPTQEQTVSIKNYAGLTKAMKDANRHRVPFATVFHDTNDTFKVSGQPETWYGRLQRNEFKIVKYEANKEEFKNSRNYGYSTFHNGTAGKLKAEGEGEGTWDEFMKDNGLASGTSDLSGAYTYYLEFISAINTTAIGSFDSVIRQQWILANDMEPDVDQLNGSFRGAKYSGDAFDKRKDGKRPIRKGLWGRYNRNEYRGTYGGMTSNTYEIGVDNAWKVNDGVSRMGVSLEYMLAGGRLGEQVGSHDKYKQTSLRLYDMWFGDRGHYYNLMFKAGAGRRDYEYNSENIRYFGNYDRNVTKVSFEYGRKKDLLPLDTDKDWVAYFIPQFQFQYAHQEGTSFYSNDNIHVSMTPTDSALMRVGFQYGFQKNKEGGAVEQWFLRANLYREFLGKENITMADSAKIWDIESSQESDQTTTIYNHQDYRGTWGELGIGTNIKFNRDASMYFDSSYYFGEAARKKYSLNLGFEFRV